MTQRLTLNSGKVELAIIKGEEFYAGSMWGETHPYPVAGRLTGTALTTLRSLVKQDAVKYTVYSYYTPIAWFAHDKWYLVVDKFSATSTRHQNIARHALVLVPSIIEIGDSTYQHA